MIPELVLGLDVSTSVTGIVVLENVGDFEPKKHVVHWTPCELAKHKSFWDKTRVLYDALDDVRRMYALDVGAIYVEEPMKRFAQGFSSAQTVSILQRMNGIACYIAYTMWNVEPTYVNVSSARKAAGVKVVQTKKDPQNRNAKQQTFDHMLANDLNHVQWPQKKSGVPKDFAYDVVDAYVIARGGMLLNK